MQMAPRTLTPFTSADIHRLRAVRSLKLHKMTYESGPSGQGAGQSRRDANGEHVYGEFV